MPLKERLSEARQQYQSSLTRCKIFKELERLKLSRSDFDAFLQALDTTDRHHPEFIPNITLSKVLRTEGLDVSNSAIDRHRNKLCSCTRAQGEN